MVAVFCRTNPKLCDVVADADFAGKLCGNSRMQKLILRNRFSRHSRPGILVAIRAAHE